VAGAGESEYAWPSRAIATAGVELERLGADYDAVTPSAGYDLLPGAATTNRSFNRRAWHVSGPLTLIGSAGRYHQVADPAFLDEARTSELRTVGAVMAIGAQLGDGGQFARLELWRKRYDGLVALTRNFEAVSGPAGAFAYAAPIHMECGVGTTRSLSSPYLMAPAPLSQVQVRHRSISERDAERHGEGPLGQLTSAPRRLILDPNHEPTGHFQSESYLAIRSIIAVTFWRFRQVPQASADEKKGRDIRVIRSRRRIESDDAERCDAYSTRRWRIAGVCAEATTGADEGFWCRKGRNGYRRTNRKVMWYALRNFGGRRRAD